MNHQNPVSRVVIVGGGTAGWMTAAALSKLIGQTLAITLVESEEIGTVGVGEATIPTLLTLHKLLKIDEREFLKSVKGTIKLGIQFENWLRADHRYIHSFGYTGESCWAAGFQHFWLKSRSLGHDVLGYGEYAPELAAAKANKFGFLKPEPLNYAYHLEASGYAKFLRGIAEQHGVTRKEGKIVSVDQSDSGDIASVMLQDGQSVAGDLFIDCSGFAGLLIDKTLKVGFDDYSHHLPCDSAVAVQTQSVSDPVPYTRAMTHSAGWQWRIPLQHRVGNGLVYSSAFYSDDEAIARLTRNTEGEILTDPRVIRFKTGQRQHHWYKNCVAIGLSAGFIEPMESTSIHLIMRAIIRLMQMFPHHGSRDADIREFNRQMREEITFIRDFIVLHYHANEHQEAPFWTAMANLDIPDTLAHRLELFRETGRVFQAQGDVFGENSWTQVMLGQGIMPQRYHHIVDMMSEPELRDFMSRQHNKVNQILDVLPNHQAFLDAYVGTQ
jgi:tryptophan halogenase